MKTALCRILALLAAVPLLSLPVFASQSTDEVLNTLANLKNGDVSYEWAADVQANADIIGKMASAVSALAQDERLELADAKDEIMQYVSALYALKDIDDTELLNSFAAAAQEPTQPPQLGTEPYAEAQDNLAKPDDIKKILTATAPRTLPIVPAGTARSRALDILASLEADGVLPESQPDIAAADVRVGEMMYLVGQYTYEELALVTRDERIAMTRYFEGLYTFMGYDALGAEGLLSTTRLAFSDTDALGFASSPTQTGQNVFIESPTSRARKSTISLVLSILAVILLCCVIIAVLTLVIKRRDDKKRGW